MSSSNLSVISTKSNLFPSSQVDNGTSAASTPESLTASVHSITTSAFGPTTTTSLGSDTAASSSISITQPSKQGTVSSSLTNPVGSSLIASPSGSLNSTIRTSNSPAQGTSETVSPASRNGTSSATNMHNGTATHSTAVSIPSGDGVTRTELPVSVSSNATIRVSTTPNGPRPTYINTPTQSGFNTSVPLSTASGWNVTRTGAGSATPTSPGLNTTWTALSTGNATKPTVSTVDVSLNGTISPVTVPLPSSRNDTWISSGSTPTSVSSPTWIPITGNITGSATTVGISVPTPFTTPVIPHSPSSDGTWSTTTPFANSTATQSTFPAANFTGVTRTAAAATETCYQLAKDPQGNTPRRALMRNANLRERNVTIPSPYVESISFESDGVDPLYLTVRNSTGSTTYLDISNKSQIAITDQDGVFMKLDAQGIYFSSRDCRYDVSIIVGDLLKQLAKLSRVECSTGGKLRKRLSDIPFMQGLTLQDQCNNPVGRYIRDYPRLSVGSSECVVVSVNEDTGFWEFDCAFPGSESGTLQCQEAIDNDVVDFLTTNPFGGACPDLSTVITTLSATGQDFLSKGSLEAELVNQGLADEEKIEADHAVESYLRVWAVLQSVFAKDSDGGSALETYLRLYNKYRDFAIDVCEDIHAGEIPLNLTLQAGASRFVLTTLNFAPEGSPPWKITVQDPAKEACCADGSVATDERGRNGTCGYPVGASLGDSGCVCGKTTSGESVAFEITECDNYAQSDCTSDQDCSDGGHSGYVCLTGTCCGGGVCIDPYACSENSTQLVTYEPPFF